MKSYVIHNDDDMKAYACIKGLGFLTVPRLDNLPFEVKVSSDEEEEFLKSIFEEQGIRYEVVSEE